MEGVVQTSMKNYPSDSDGYVCPLCEEFVPKIEVKLLGAKRMVQPTCQCEVEEMEREQAQFENHRKRREIEKLFSISNLGQRFEDSSFDRFIARSGAEKAVGISKRYVDEFDDWGADSLMLWGVPGNGKSHLAAAVANELNTKGKIVVFQSVPELLQRIRSTFNKNSEESEHQIMKALLDCDLLMLDDIGAEKLTDWVQDVVFRIIDGRYRKRKPIFYTSNLKPKFLADQLGERTYDRVTETSLLIENKATSYRREIAKKRMEQYADA
jgi:DNA replication protein DnaC